MKNIFKQKEQHLCDYPRQSMWASVSLLKFAVVFVVLLFISTFFFILPPLLKDKFYSFYFDYDHADPVLFNRVLDQNKARAVGARRYLEHMLVLQEEFKHDSFQSQQPVANMHGSINIAIGIITMQRSVEKERKVKLGYLSQTAAAIHRLAQEDKHFGSKHIFLCNIDPDATKFHEAMQLAPLFDMTVKYNESDKNVRRNFKSWEIYEREKQDYQYCLKKALQYQTPYVLLMEDDAVPNRNMFAVLHKAFIQKGLATQNLKRDQNVNSKWGYIKLYYPEKWAGYGSELNHFIELFGIGLLGGMLFYSFWTICVMFILRKSHRRLLSVPHALMFSFGATYVTLLAWTTGRVYIMRLLAHHFDRYTVMEARNCCTQAVLYSSGMIQDLVDYLDTVECDIMHSIDIALDDFRGKTGFKAYLIEPNIFTHVGMFSTLRTKSPGEFL